MHSVNRDILAMELGHIILESGLPTDFEDLIQRTQFSSIKTLTQIKAILDNTSLNDSECVEEIVELLWQVGIRTSRHDFG